MSPGPVQRRLLVSLSSLVLVASSLGLFFAPVVGAAEDCSSGVRTLSAFGDRVYPDQGNGGYTSVHTDLFLNYDTLTNLFLAGTRADLTILTTQCLTDFSFDFERAAMSGSAAGPNLAVGIVSIDGVPTTYNFRQPTYPGNPNGPDDPDPLAHAISNVVPVSATNPNPPACSPQVSGNSQNGAQCPANKLVITPAAPIPAGTTLTVSIPYTGRPGVHTDGDGSTEGWFRVNTAAAPNDGSFVTTEPIGNMAWMPLNNHPTAKPTYDIYDTVPVGKTAIGPGELGGYVPSTTETAAQPTAVNAPNANFPAGSWTWHWHSPERIANYLVTNSIGSYDLTIRTSATSGVQYYSAMASGLTAARKAAIKPVLDTQESITVFQEKFNGAWPFTTDGVIVALPSVGFAEEMQTKITFGNGASSTPSVGTFHHENMHQWWGDQVAEGSFRWTFWKEGWATVGEYLNTARTAAGGDAGMLTPAGQTAFDNSLISRFNTNYASTGSFWTVAPSNPTVGNLFTTANTYTRPGTAYLALRAILDSSLTRPGFDRWKGAMLQIQNQYGGGSITKPQLQQVFHEWLPNQDPACHQRLDEFFVQWFDTAFATGGGANRPQITGPGLAGPGFYDDASACQRATQVLTFGPLAGKTFLDPDFTVSATSTAGLPITFTASGNCTVAGATVHLTGAGSCTITANQAGDGVYKPASNPQTFSIAKAGQAITFGVLANQAYGNPDFAPGATASSGLAVDYTAVGDCTIVGGLVHITAVGSCDVTAHQAGNVDYLAAPDVSRSFTIAQAGTSTAAVTAGLAPNPVAQFSDSAALRATVTVAPTATGDGVFSGSVAFTFDGIAVGSAPVSNVAPTAQVTVKLDDVRIPTGAGSYPMTAVFTPDAGSNYAGSTSNAPGAVAREGESGGLADGSVSVDYTGDQFVLLGSTPNLVATVSQGLPPEAGDTEMVDFSNSAVYVRFRIYPDGSATPTWSSSPIRVANRSDWAANGTGFVQVSGPGGLAEDSYTVVAELVPNTYVLAEDDAAALEVASASGSFITGGGFVPVDSTANTTKPKGQFGFNVSVDKKVVKGKASYKFRMRLNTATSTTSNLVPCTTASATCRDVDFTIKSTKLNALSTSDGPGYPMTGFATGNMTVLAVDILTGNHLAALEWGGGTFRIDVTDAANGGSNDLFGFSAYRKDGSLFHAAKNPGPINQTGTGAATNQTPIGGGNVTVHPK